MFLTFLTKISTGLINQNIKIKKETELSQQNWNEQVNKKWDNLPMPPERMMIEISKSLPQNSIIVDDSISSRSAMHGAIKFNKAGSIFGERGGAIGWGMGGALGVKLANPDKPVMAIIGDGSSMMTVQALWTAANYSIPVIYLICNNESYRILKLNMKINDLAMSRPISHLHPEGRIVARVAGVSVPQDGSFLEVRTCPLAPKSNIGAIVEVI